MNKSPTIILIMIFMGWACGLSAQISEQIKLNQIGFYPYGPKLAVITGECSSRKFYVVSDKQNDTVFVGSLSDEKKSAYSSTIARVADFSSVTRKGSYMVLVPGVGRSYIFQITDHVLQQAALAALKGFYYQRSSVALEEKFAGKWHREAGHPDNSVIVHVSAASAQRPEGTIISTPGGWYDAGDYNKYIVNSGITMGTLLSAYEDFPLYFKNVDSQIPEGLNSVPDIVDEIVYNLRWMLTMQDPSDGGVYNKCTNAVFDGMVMPGITKAPRYVVQKGTAATLDFAAVAAQAKRVLQKFEKQFPGLSDSCLAAALKAWQWALHNPAVSYNQNELNKTKKPAVLTGGYGDRKFSDEWTWAAAELFVTTRDRDFYDTYAKYSSDSISLPGWSDVEMLGHYTMIRCQKSLPKYTQNHLSITKQRLLQFADSYLIRTRVSAFHTVMGQSARDFSWGSNANAANQGILLINAFLVTKDKKYLHHALSNADYLLGRNATGFSFLTGFGCKPPQHPHHRPSEADGIDEPVPGLLVGGPNPGRQDGCTYPFSEPENSYADAVCSYASNEIAINWNAPLVYLLHAAEALANTAFKK